MTDVTTTPNHPSSFLPKDILTKIRALAPAAEELHSLHPEQLMLIHSHNWFRMFVPKSRGGLGSTLPEALHIEEALAWADGSTAWVVTLCSGAGWFAGFIDPTIAHTLFAGEETCLAGSGAPTGTAQIDCDEFVVNGEWKYASGALHATAFTANCVLTQNNKPLTDDGGKPLIRSFVFLREEVKIARSWRTMGMVATASHSFSVSGLRVPRNRMFQINRVAIQSDDAVYTYPFLQLAEATLAVNFSGMAQQFVDLCTPILAGRSANVQGMRSKPNDVLQQAIKSLFDYRQDFYEAVETSWSFCSHGHTIPDVVLRQVSDRSNKLYHTSLNLVSTLYPFLGLRGADPGTELNRIFRNIFTASQHTLFSLR